MKLLSLQLPDHPVLRSLSHFYCANPPPILKGFTVKVRGKAVFLVSPRGWERDLTEHQRKPDGPRRTFGPIDGVHLQWEGDDVDAVLKYDSPPMGVPELSDEELERVTAPKVTAQRR